MAGQHLKIGRNPAGISVPTFPIDVSAQGSQTVDVTFSDPAGVLDESYTCDFDMDYDGVTVSNDITVGGVTGTACSASLDYAEPGVYTVRVIVTYKGTGTVNGSGNFGKRTRCFS